MSPTPPSVDVFASTPGHGHGHGNGPDNRTRRNVAKLEQLEQELRSIKQVVQPDAVWTQPSPRAAIAALQPDQGTASAAAVINTSTTAPQAATARPESSTSQGRSAQSSERRLKTGPAEARVLGNHIVSGDDVDWYFTNYLQHFHRFLPVLRKRDPDECYEANQTLFWLVIYVACRRYARDRALLPLLTDHLEGNIWTMSSAPALDFDAVHALLIMCTWPMPNIRFITDPSPTFAAIATTTALGLGCHTGQGRNPQFLLGLRQNFQATDEEASSTWLACCMLSQRTACGMGIPPPSIQHSDARVKAALDVSQWVDLIIMHDVQRFLNRFHTSMFTQITARGGVHESEVALWETEFESLKPLITKHDSDISRFCLLAAQLEIQLCYFIAPPNTAVPSIKSHAVRVFNTARSFVAHSLDLESRTQFLTHAPQWVTRTNIDAACIIVSILHSDCSPVMNEPDAQHLVQQACGALLRTSVRDADLAHRVSIITETFWSIRNLVPSFGPAPGARPDRSSAGVTFWCLNKFRTALRDARNSTDRVNKTLELMREYRPPLSSLETAANGDQPANSNV
ncbi:uncharacterized protein MAM_01557 [Metarhizium album ARSEF 1941]|uniref:Transcription factor, fungi n=1 Tax=Metarhizium album (strain ARSEF 1941) TaxID=1081103 RepID=A0A0B2X382_METAS|nr:uncharacterized protein MAM_01557 [Metarhizium album ARSEF 1941]KHO00779.1 Transcription factor, fungi [Metarhizium album ARSEF 1941]